MKMKWLIDNLNSGQDNRPDGAKQMTDWMMTHGRGLLIAPTGYGKSGIIFYYIVQRLRKAIEEGKKLVFTLSTPLLVLNDQFYSDLIEVLTHLNGQPLNRGNCVFVDNSSVTSDQGATEGWIDPQQQRSIYFFWLGSKHHGSVFNNMSQYLMSKECPLNKYKKVLYIDGQDLMANTPAGFWSNNFQNAVQLLY